MYHHITDQLVEHRMCLWIRELCRNNGIHLIWMSDLEVPVKPNKQMHVWKTSFLEFNGVNMSQFELSLTSGKSPPWLNDYSDFVGELKNNFGPHNPKGEAEANLENLKMRDNQCIMKYLVNFNRLAACVQWGDATLHRQMYRGLPCHIKDEIACIGKPDTLHELHSLTQSINSQYWECHSEVARENL